MCVLGSGKGHPGLEASCRTACVPRSRRHRTAGQNGHTSMLAARDRDLHGDVPRNSGRADPIPQADSRTAQRAAAALVASADIAADWFEARGLGPNMRMVIPAGEPGVSRVSGVAIMTGVRRSTVKPATASAGQATG